MYGIREKCAVIGVKSNTDVFESLYYGLYSLQHRGQESAGIAVQTDQIRVHKDMGLVSDVFRNAYLSGNIGIGHVRYSTTGSSSIENAHPLLINYTKGSFAIAHNGNIVNQDELRSQLEEKGNIFLTTSDTEIIAVLIAQEHMRTNDFVEAIKSVMKQLVGSYSLTILYDKKLIAVRDPSAIRPLCFGQKDGTYVVASESCALDVLGIPFVRDLRPSEILVIGDNVESHSGPKGKVCHCMFEYVYFSRPDSVVDGKCVYMVRKELGKILAKEAPVKADMVMAVPDSGISHAIGYSEGAGIRYGEGLIKNRYIGRTFILPDQKQRDLGVRVKLNPIACKIKDKELIMVDDSLVRGTTLKRIVKILREAGTKKVHVRICCPPIRFPCLYGIDMQTSKEFIAAEKTVDEIRSTLGADTLAYLSIEGMVKAIGHDKEDLCMACLTGDYPLKEKQTKLL
ncbi:MAG: amidophosphoribosyltransferase [Candidatus Altiarchaeota archaeon]|nr:amidophosphoribosyltransferase [Candidatus Altiarchaeota archaeon]